MSFFKEVILPPVYIAWITIILVAIMTFVIWVSGMGLEIAVNPQIKVYVEGEEVYQGNKAMVNFGSAGFYTKVTIYKNLGFVTDKVYLSQDVRVEMVEEK